MKVPDLPEFYLQTLSDDFSRLLSKHLYQNNFLSFLSLKLVWQSQRVKIKSSSHHFSSLAIPSSTFSFVHFHSLLCDAGARCEECAPGYYGNPSQPGGRCQPCQCNNNIDMSDMDACDRRTGECRKCLYNTEGSNCNLCRSGYYGDAARRNCRSKWCDKKLKQKKRVKNVLKVLFCFRVHVQLPGDGAQPVHGAGWLCVPARHRTVSVSAQRCGSDVWPLRPQPLEPGQRDGLWAVQLWPQQLCHVLVQRGTEPRDPAEPTRKTEKRVLKVSAWRKSFTRKNGSCFYLDVCVVWMMYKLLPLIAKWAKVSVVGSKIRSE